MKYKVGCLLFDNGGNGAVTDERYQGLNGRIIIGGDQGDIYAEDSFNNCNLKVPTVVLYDVELYSGIENLTSDEAYNLAQDIIWFSYRSIGAETFKPTSRNSR